MRIDIGGGVRLFIDVEGAALVPDGPRLREKPVMLLLHGGPGFDHASFKPVFSRLAERCQLIYVDHRGHGRSDPRPVSEWTLDTWADDVVRLCDALGVHKPIVLGQSFGGFVAQRYLARHPAHARGVVLSSTSPTMALPRKLAMFERLGGERARALAQAFWSAPDAAAFDAAWPPYLAEVMPLYNTRPAADPQARARQITRLEILRHFVLHEQHAMDLRIGLDRAACPVLVLAGDEDPVCPVDDAADIAAALPPALTRFVRIPDAGHGTWRDQPEAAFRVLEDFVDAVA